MSDRIEPIRRTDVARGVPAVAPVQRREPRRDDDQPPPRRRPPSPPARSVTRDEDGTPHVDVRV
jgi:hypothetical protein